MAMMTMMLPDFSMSRVEMTLVEKASAFEGVEIGRSMSKEHESATITANKSLFSPGKLMTNGTIRFAVAVLLTKMETKTVSKPESKPAGKPLGGAASASSSAGQ